MTCVVYFSHPFCIHKQYKLSMKIYSDVEIRALPRSVASAINVTLVREGEMFTEHENDHPTKWGIRRLSADRAGYTGDIKTLNKNNAFKIWALLFYYVPKLNLIFDESDLIGETVLDTSGPAGVVRGVRHLQEALTSFNMLNNPNGLIYGPDLKLDGVMGPKTQRQLRLYLEHRKNSDGEYKLATRLNCLQDAHYTELAIRNPGKRDFSFGWLSGRVYPDLLALSASDDNTIV